uniref:Matrin-type domain-containing protein n=1 Tax=Ciona savignyi TaxID=51511 RepID=H2Z750_CIOSA
MDFQNRAGGKTGSGGVASMSDANRDRRERLRQLALETIDLNKDPYFMKNHLGSYECKLCLTLHNNEATGSYLAHTQGKKHQSNLGKRAARDAKEAPIQPAPAKPMVEVKKFVKIGRPGYKVTKQRVPESGQQSLLFQVDYPEIVETIQPRHRFMSAYEQHIEPPDKSWQYLLFAAEPYETVSFKVPSREIDKGDGKFWTHWNKDTKQFFLQFHYKMETRPPPMMAPHDDEAPPGTLPPPPPHGDDESDFHDQMPFMGGQPHQNGGPGGPMPFNNFRGPPPPMGPPMGGPPMGGPPMGGPPMGGPPMGGQQMGGPQRGGPQMGGPPMGGPPQGMMGHRPPMGPPMMRGPGHPDGFMDQGRGLPPPPPMAPPP